MKERVRLWLMQLVSAGFRIATPAAEVDDRALLVVAPHPDDDVLGCGGLIAAKVQLGARVEVVFLTDGAASHLGHPEIKPAQLAKQRRSEAIEALKELGVPPEQVVFLDLPDGRLDRLNLLERASAIGNLREILRANLSLRMLIPLANEGSSEHSAANEIAREAGQPEEVEIIEYAVWAWWHPKRLLPFLRQFPRPLRFEIGSYRSTKRAALLRHRSQMQALPPWDHPVLPPSLAEACCGPRELYFPHSERKDFPKNHVI